MTTEITVTSCSECPFYGKELGQGEVSHNCHYYEYTHNETCISEGTAEDLIASCPLKQSTLTIKIKSDDTPATDTTL